MHNHRRPRHHHEPPIGLAPHEASCRKHDIMTTNTVKGKKTTECMGAKPLPSWCDRSFCFVDPNNCTRAPETSGFFPHIMYKNLDAHANAGTVSYGCCLAARRRPPAALLRGPRTTRWRTRTVAHTHTRARAHTHTHTHTHTRTCTHTHTRVRAHHHHHPYLDDPGQPPRSYTSAARACSCS